MKTKQTIIAALVLIATTVTFAQKSIFETIEANGEDAVYTQYTGVSKQEGKYLAQNKGATVHIKIGRTPAGIPMGVLVIDTAENRQIKSMTENSKTELMDHYSAPAFIRDINYYDSFLMVDNMLFEVDRLRDTGNYDGLDAIYVLESADSDLKPKKKKKGFLNKLKDRVVDQYGPTTDKNQKMIKNTDIDGIISSYFTAMKARQLSENPATAKRNKDAVWGFKRDRFTKINKYNDSILKNDPQYRRAYEDRLKGGVSNGNVSLENTSNEEVLIISGASNTSKMTIGRGQSKNWNCYSDAYIGKENNDGSSVTYTEIRKIYSADSKCQGKVSF